MDPQQSGDWLYALLDMINGPEADSSADLLVRFASRLVSTFARHIKKVRRSRPKAGYDKGPSPFSEGP